MGRFNSILLFNLLLAAFCFADDNSFEKNVFLDIDQPVLTQNSNINITVFAPSFASQYILVIGSKSQNFEINDKEIKASATAYEIKSGDLDRDGKTEIKLDWSKFNRGIAYLQIAVFNRNFRKFSISQAKAILDLPLLMADLGIAGPQGPAGPAGQKGEQGLTGPQGPIGLTGPIGQNGRDGKDGLNGIDGINGTQGEKGAQGEVGPQGPVGPAGPSALEVRPVAFSGGCTHSSSLAGHNQYCLDGQDFNTAQDYFDVNPDGTITFKKSGFYQIDMWATAQARVYIELYFLKNSQPIWVGYNYLGQTHGEMRGNLLWPFESGDKLTIDILHDSGGLSSGGQGIAYNQWSSTSLAYSRLQLKFVGPLQ